MNFTFSVNWITHVGRHGKFGLLDFLSIAWNFGKDFNPRWASITILNFEFGFEIWDKTGE